MRESSARMYLQFDGPISCNDIGGVKADNAMKHEVVRTGFGSDITECYCFKVMCNHIDCYVVVL